jgi:hypothetical protein
MYSRGNLQLSKRTIPRLGSGSMLFMVIGSLQVTEFLLPGCNFHSKIRAHTLRGTFPIDDMDFRERKATMCKKKGISS